MTGALRPVANFQLASRGNCFCYETDVKVNNLQETHNIFFDQLSVFVLGNFIKFAKLITLLAVMASAINGLPRALLACCATLWDISAIFEGVLLCSHKEPNAVFILLCIAF